MGILSRSFYPSPDNPGVYRIRNIRRLNYTYYAAALGRTPERPYKRHPFKY